MSNPLSNPSSAISSSSSSNSEDKIDLNFIIQQDQLLMAQQAQLFEMFNNRNLQICSYLNNIESSEVTRGGSIHGHRMIHRDREVAAQNLWNDYFSENPRYNERMFRRRFRMGRNLFTRIVDAVKHHDDYFQQQTDATGRLGLSTLQKITTTFRMLAYGVPADSTDEYIKIGESTAIESMKRFCRAIVNVFGEQYLRSPNAHDVARLLKISEKRGFQGMLGSLDCMHWQWKNCPVAWGGHYSGRSGSPTIILEVVADYDLWIWHAYFGLPGSNNDINVLESSHLFADLASGVIPKVRYVIQGKEYNTGYYLADGIYPKWSTLVQTIHDPQGLTKKLFAAKQEACRKDVERAFGVLQSQFAIIKGPSRLWSKRSLHDIMTTCIIMHNMIVEDERDLEADIVVNMEVPTPDVEMVTDPTIQFQQFLARHRQMRNRESHFELRNALIEHLWEQHGNSSD